MIVPRTKELAIKNGCKAVPDDLKVGRWPIIEKEDILAVMKVLERGEFMENVYDSEDVPSLEREYAEYVGVKHCVATNSGTSSLHMAVAACGIGPGDEVIVTAFSFVASGVSILHNQAIPVFVDIDPKTYNIDPKKIEEKISERTKAIMAVDFQGLPADMDEIKAVAKKFNLVVIEDGSQAEGATYKGRKTGSLGDICGASIVACKPLASGGEGGLLTTDNDEYYEKAERMKTFGEIIPPDGKQLLNYNALALGYNYKMVPFCAAMARTQLRRLDEYNKLRQDAAEYLSKELDSLPGLQSPIVPSDRTHTYYAYRFRVNAEEAGLDLDNGRFRQALQDILVAEGVPVGAYQIRPIPGQTIFQEKKGYGKGCPWTCPHARKVEYDMQDYPETLRTIEETLRFPPQHYPPLSRKILDVYLGAFKKVFDQLGEVEDYAKRLDYRPPWEVV